VLHSRRRGVKFGHIYSSAMEVLQMKSLMAVITLARSGLRRHARTQSKS
jgi:hypothetical protein